MVVKLVAYVIDEDYIGTEDRTVTFETTAPDATSTTTCLMFTRMLKIYKHVIRWRYQSTDRRAIVRAKDRKRDEIHYTLEGDCTRTIAKVFLDMARDIDSTVGKLKINRFYNPLAERFDDGGYYDPVVFRSIHLDDKAGRAPNDWHQVHYTIQLREARKY